MGKWIAISLVAAVFATITGMWFMFDRAQGRPNAALMKAAIDGNLAGEARKSVQNISSGAANAAMEASRGAELEAARDSQKAAPAKDQAQPKEGQPKTDAPAGAKTGAKMVQPEELPQGFIIVVTDKTKKASRESPIHMPSSHNGWNPQDQGMKLEPQSDMKWRIEWAKPKLDSRIAFKFARGSWEQVETTADFKDIDNRMLPMVDVSKLAPGEKPIIELEIEQWRDNAPGQTKTDAANKYRPISVSAGTIKRVEVTGGAQASMVRDLLVWLPPGYDAPENATRSYPVLYMQDGQNLFEKIPGIPAEWQADETAAKLIAEGKIEPLIIVGIPHAGAGRISEYSPIALVDGNAPRGAAYLSFLTSEVMPRVERAFRVKTGPQNTAIGGSSLGGLIALDAGASSPGVFGKVLAESPSITLSNRAGFRHLASKPTWPARIYLGMGGSETGNAGDNQAMVAGAEALGELARGKGVKSDAMLINVDRDAKHDEAAWAKRFPQALMFLFPAKN